MPRYQLIINQPGCLPDVSELGYQSPEDAINSAEEYATDYYGYGDEEIDWHTDTGTLWAGHIISQQRHDEHPHAIDWFVGVSPYDVLSDRVTAVGDLQCAILERCDDPQNDEDEDTAATLLRDMASGYDPVYQFVGMIPTEGIVIDLYHEYKEDIVEAITELASYDRNDRQARSIIEWSPYRSTPDTFDSHADFAGRCLKIAFDYHAGQLASQLD